MFGAILPVPARPTVRQKPCAFAWVHDIDVFVHKRKVAQVAVALLDLLQQHLLEIGLDFGEPCSAVQDYVENFELEWVVV